MKRTIDKKQLKEEMLQAINHMKEHDKEGGCTYWYLDTNLNGNDWAIVIGWSEVERDTYELRMKVAFQPSNSIMQCDYDVDWMMAYDRITSEVYDCDLAIYEENIDEDIDWLLEYYDSEIINIIKGGM